MRTSPPPDLQPLDPTVDYGRETQRAGQETRLRDLYGERDARALRQVRGVPMRRTDVPFWTAPPGYCRWCGHPLDYYTARGKRVMQRRWHDECVTAYTALGSQQGFRAAVWERDRGVCAACPPGTPPCRRFPAHRPTAYVDSLGRAAEYLNRQTGATRGDMPHHARYAGTTSCQMPGCAGEDLHVRSRPVEGPIDDREWNADHIVPLWAGGAHSMENAQTLCSHHHAQKTRREARDRANLRRAGVR